jgi:hypothetical protein
MNREQFIRALRKLARERGVFFEVDKKSGKGSHYRVQFEGGLSTVQDKLNPERIQRILKQLEIDPAEL